MANYFEFPKRESDALALESFLNSPQGDRQVYRHKRTLAPEWYPQSGVQLTWPHKGQDWAYMLEEVTACYLRMAYEMALREPLLIVTPEPDAVRALLQEKLPSKVCERIRYFACDTNDTWARDHAFLSVTDHGKAELHDFRFNGWGGKFEAASDNAINRKLYDQGLVEGFYVNHLDFELEGGSVESDGMGTLLTTTTCLLNPNRNPSFSKAEIEARLCAWFGVEQVLWLSHGYMEGDDTDSHIDTLARLCPNDTILYMQSTDETDAHHAELVAMESELQAFRTLTGQPFRLLPLPMPPAIYFEGERLPATYANYLVMNRCVLYPTYGFPELEARVERQLATAFPGYDLVGIDCRALIKQHGSLHCATMQYPIGILK